MLQERVGLRWPLDEGGSIVPGPVSDAKGAVRLRSRAGGIATTDNAAVLRVAEHVKSMHQSGATASPV